MASDLDDDLALLTEAALAAGEIALGHFRTKVDVFWKNGGASPVTAADLAANAEIRRILTAGRPDYGWLSEENEDDEKRLSRKRVFVVDPIDGTRAFMQGLETWVVSVAVVEAGRPFAGVLVAPALSETWQAGADGRVLKNGEPLVRQPPSGDSLVVSGAEEMFARMGEGFSDRVRRVRSAPSLAYRLAMIADGRLDATLVKAHAHDWDIAAAELILVNAGGRLIDQHGAPVVYNRREPVHPRMLGFGLPRAGRLETEFLAAMAR